MEDDNNTASKLIEIKEILDKLKNRKEETLLTGLRECQLKNIEHPFITKEEYIDKVLDYIINLQHTEDLYNQLLKDYDELQERIEKASSLIEPLVEWGECTINGKMLKSVYDILNGKE